MKLTTGVHREKWKAFISTSRPATRSLIDPKKKQNTQTQTAPKPQLSQRCNLNARREIDRERDRERTHFTLYGCVCVYVHVRCIFAARIEHEESCWGWLPSKNKNKLQLIKVKAAFRSIFLSLFHTLSLSFSLPSRHSLGLFVNFFSHCCQLSTQTPGKYCTALYKHT